MAKFFNVWYDMKKHKFNFLKKIYVFSYNMYFYSFLNYLF